MEYRFGRFNLLRGACNTIGNGVITFKSRFWTRKSHGFMVVHESMDLFFLSI